MQRSNGGAHRRHSHLNLQTQWPPMPRLVLLLVVRLIALDVPDDLAASVQKDSPVRGRVVQMHRNTPNIFWGRFYEISRVSGAFLAVEDGLLGDLNNLRCGERRQIVLRPPFRRRTHSATHAEQGEDEGEIK